MIKVDLNRLMVNVFKEDKFRNGENTIFSQLAIITIKSFLPDCKIVGNKVDYKRFHEELKLLKYYKIEKENHILLGISEKDYFTYKDKTIYSRLLPIIISNTDFEILEDQVIKNILLTTGDVESLLEALAISKLIYMLINGQVKPLEDLKQYIINFSQVGYLEKHKKYYLFDCLKENRNFEINFEKTKVSLITFFHGIDLGKFRFLSDLIGVLEGKSSKTSIGMIIEKTIKEEGINCQIDESYVRIASYLLKLRKSRINPDDLKLKEYILPDIFSFKEGEVFFHSLLNNSKVIKKEVKDGTLTSLVETRGGMYLFKRDPFN